MICQIQPYHFGALKKGYTRQNRTNTNLRLCLLKILRNTFPPPQKKKNKQCKDLPSRKRSHIPPLEKEHHRLKSAEFWDGICDRSQEGILFTPWSNPCFAPTITKSTRAFCRGCWSVKLHHELQDIQQWVDFIQGHIIHGFNVDNNHNRIPQRNSKTQIESNKIVFQ